MKKEIKLNIVMLENDLYNFSKLEKLLYKIIENSLNKISIEYLKFNEISLKRYNIKIGYNIYTEKLQFYDENDNYLKNIHYILLNNNFNNVIEYILNEIDKYLNNYYLFCSNVLQTYNILKDIYL